MACFSRVGYTQQAILEIREASYQISEKYQMRIPYSLGKTRLET